MLILVIGDSGIWLLDVDDQSIGMIRFDVKNDSLECLRNTPYGPNAAMLSASSLSETSYDMLSGKDAF